MDAERVVETSEEIFSRRNAERYLIFGHTSSTSIYMNTTFCKCVCSCTFDHQRVRSSRDSMSTCENV